MIYLDNAATTFPKPDEVYKALDKAIRTAVNTGRGSYKIAREKTAIIDETRELLLKINKIIDSNIVFTSSATVACNAIIEGIDYSDGDNIYISPFEHNSIIRVLEDVKNKYKLNIHILPFDKNTWELDIKKMNNMFALNKPKAIFLSHVSNVTGYILPYNDIFEAGKKYKSINVLDSSQGYGIVPINNVELIDYIVFAGHKSLYASFGIAGFIEKNNLKLKKFIFGGTGSDTMNPNMPDSGYLAYEAGSPNIVAIEGLNASIKWIENHNIYDEEQKNTKYLIDELKKIESLKVFLPKNENNIFGVVSFGVNGYTSDEVGKILDDEFEICVRTGFHCAPLVHDFIGSLVYNGTVRCSLSYFTSREDIDNLLRALKTL